MNSSLRLESLVKRYGELTAVDSLTLEALPGEILGLLGPNGAGKSTTISMICGLARPDSGRILLGGEDLCRDGRRRSIGYCPQAVIVWERLSCLEQLEYVGRLYGASRAAARSRSGLLLEAFGLAEKAKKQARFLSGGMQRRLNIALALIHDPELLVLDEPEAGLDPQSRALVRDYIRSLASRKTVILATHNMDEAERLADRVAIIDGGKLLELGAPAALLERYGEGGRSAPDLEYVFLRLTGRRLRE